MGKPKLVYIISKDWVGRDSFLVKWEDSTESDGHRRRSSDRRDSSISSKLTENPIEKIALIMISRYNDFL